MLHLIQSENPRNYNEGAYAVVFFGSDGRATKVFKRRGGDPPGHTNRVFRSEVQAYRLAISCNHLKTLVPCFYGDVVVKSVTDDKGADLSNRFFLEYAYQMQFIKGNFVSSGCFRHEDIADVFRVFHDAGIKHTRDASILVEDGHIRCVIDFAIKEYEL